MLLILPIARVTMTAKKESMLKRLLLAEGYAFLLQVNQE